jgi:hypothetical protein
LRNHARKLLLRPVIYETESYSGETVDRKQGNITITMNRRATIASCISSSQLSSGKSFTRNPNIEPSSPVAHPTSGPYAETFGSSTSH